MHIVDAASIKEKLFRKYQQEAKQVRVSSIHDKVLELNEIYVPLRFQNDDMFKRGTVSQSDEHSFCSLTDIFNCDNTTAERIFLKGESGTGKTTLCLKLLQSWVDAQECNNFAPDSLEGCLDIFHLVFYIPLRDIREGTKCIVDMICEQVSSGDPEMIYKIKHVLSCRDIRCLIVVDGVDEWKTSKVGLEYPDTYGLVNCVLLSTMRPWVISKMQLKLNVNDEAYEVLGLEPDHIGDMISKVLINFCGLQTNSFEYQTKYDNYCAAIRQSELNTILNPMMLLALILIWNEEDIEGYRCREMSRTRLYLSMIEVMIQRAESKDKDVQSYLKRYVQNEKKSSIDLFGCFSDSRYITYFWDVILPFSKLAYEGLIEDKESLIFEKHQLEIKFSPEKVKLALKIGFIGEEKSNATARKQTVSIHFLHKSIQELLAAIFILHGGKEALNKFLTQCSSVISIMKLSNLITFICGLDFSFADRTLKHVAKMAEEDKNISFYRQLYRNHSLIEEPNVNLREGSYRVKYIYFCQCLWYKEMMSNAIYTQNVRSVDYMYHIKFIYLDKSSDRETKEMTLEIMRHSSNTIESVSFCDEASITENIVSALATCKNITSLQICYIADQNLRDLLCGAVNQLTRLEYLKYWGSIYTQLHWKDHRDFLESVNSMCSPKCIDLSYIAVNENLLPRMSRANSLKSVQLSNILNSDKGWKKFIKSLMRQGIESKITLDDTNIDGLSVSLIDSSSKFTVVCNEDQDDVFRHRFILFYTHSPAKLKYLGISNITLHDSKFCRLEPMTSLKIIHLSSINMWSSGWDAFIDRTCDSGREIFVDLEHTDICETTVSRVVAFPFVTVIINIKETEGSIHTRLCFYTTPPSKLETITLKGHQLGDSGFSISNDMTKLNQVHLLCVQMSRAAWCKFVDSIRNVEKRGLYVKLVGTNIDGESIASISSCAGIVMESGRRTQSEEEVVLYVRYLQTYTCASCQYGARDRLAVCHWFLCMLSIAFVISFIVFGVWIQVISDGKLHFLTIFFSFGIVFCLIYAGCLCKYNRHNNLWFYFSREGTD